MEKHQKKGENRINHKYIVVGGDNVMSNFKQKYRSILRYNINKRNRERLKYDPENPISIISCNCIGGVIYHDLGLRFDSPTINMFFEPGSYVEYISHLKEYSQAELIEIPSEYDYPMGQLGDEGKVVIHLVHYASFDEAKRKWNERNQRINYENLFFILTERDGITYEQMKQFDNFSYEHKVLLTCHDYSGLDSAYCLGGVYGK